MFDIDRLKEMALEDIENNPEKYLEEYAELLQQLDQLKAEVEKYKQLADSFEADFYNALSDKGNEYIRALRAEKEVIRNYLGCGENQTILERLDQLKTAQEIDQITYIKQLEKTIIRIRTIRDNHIQILQEIKEMCKQKLPAGLSAPSCYESFEAFTGCILQKCEVIDE